VNVILYDPRTSKKLIFQELSNMQISMCVPKKTHVHGIKIVRMFD